MALPIIVTIVALLLGGAVVTACYWDEIRGWAIETAASWVRSHLGARAESLLRSVIVVLDRVISPARRRVRRVLRAEVYGQSTRTVSEEEIPMEDLPDDVQQELRRGRVTHEYEVES